MTFEELKKLAGAKPEFNCKSIFKVETFFIGFWDMNENGEMIDPYIESYSMDLDEPIIYYFFTYEDAKRQILSEQAKNPRSFHSARIIQLPAEIETQEGEYLSFTVFDKRMEICFRSRVPMVESFVGDEDYISPDFYGYLKENMPFQKGEIVEVLDTESDSVRLGIIAETPLSLEDNWENSLTSGRLRGILDRFKIVTGEDESGYFKTDFIFKPSFPVSAQIRERLNEWYENDPHAGSTDFAGLLSLI